MARAERKKGEYGRYIVAFADDYGLGNRVNVVVSSLALAMATGRALAIVWPRVDCKRNAREFCDPTSVDDLPARPRPLLRERESERRSSRDAPGSSRGP